MPTRIENSTQRRVVLSSLFFLPFALLVVLTVSLFVLSSALRTSHVWVKHTLDVKNSIGSVYNHLLEAESAARGFLLTGDAAFLADKEIAMRAPAELQRTRRLTSDNQIQQQALVTLEPLIRDRLDLLTQLATLRRKNTGEEMRTVIENGKQQMETIRPILIAMEKEESRLLELREARATDQSRFTRIIAAVSLLVDLSVLAVIAFLMRRAQRLQQLATVCAWTKTIEYEGEWISFEEYLKRRFGISVTHSISRAAYDKLRADVNTQTTTHAAAA